MQARSMQVITMQTITKQSIPMQAINAKKKVVFVGASELSMVQVRHLKYPRAYIVMAYILWPI